MSRMFRRHSTRARILRLIKLKGRASIEQLRDALGITTIAVRGQLRRLRKAGIVLADQERRPRGRPVDLFRLTASGDNLFPKAYLQFLMELLRSVANLDGPEKVGRLFQNRKERFLAKHNRRMVPKSPEARVREAIRILCAQGHMAESRRVDACTFLVTGHNCTIAEIARQYPQVCQTELAFLSEFLGAEVRRESHMVKGDPQCSYRVRFPLPSAPIAPEHR